MIILSLIEKTLSAFEKKIAHSEGADLFELRLDHLNSISLKDIEKRLHQYPLLITLRSKEEGGEKAYSLAKRHEILMEMIDLKPKYLDLEYSRDIKLLPYIKKNSPTTKIILSYHSFKEPLKNIEKKFLEMKKHAAWKYKIASQSTSILDAMKVLQAIRKHSDFIGISMGEKGIMTRLLGPIYNQPITYASLDGKRAAPGQLTLKELSEFYSYKSYNKKTKILGLIGNPVWQSPGTRIYNTLFLKEKANAIYLNFELEDKELKKFIPLAKELGFFALSVTIPFKEKILPFLSTKEKKQKDIGSINTVLFRKSGLYGMNSDGLGALEMIEQKGKVKNKKVLIVGAGGTAYGIGYVFQNAGAKITLMNRTDSKAKALAKKLKGDFRSFSEVNHLKESDYDILIHTTPIGNKNKKDCLIPREVIFAKKTILDVVFNDSELLKLAQKKSCKTYNGKEFWVWQAHLQYKLWFKDLPTSLKKKLKQHMP